eukprot:jgi/Orpsp1_1/1183718/evm.model.c7180000086408.1
MEIPSTAANLSSSSLNPNLNNSNVYNNSINDLDNIISIALNNYNNDNLDDRKM